MTDLREDVKNYLARSNSDHSKTKTNYVDFIKNSTFKSWIFPAKSNVSEETNILIEDSESGDINRLFIQSEKDSCFPTLSKGQRIVGFVGCILIGFFCFTLAGFYVPFLLLKARKFALLYSLGSLFIICSFSLLWGPVTHAKQLCSRERLPFTSIYFGTMFTTLYFALWARSTIPTAVSAICQVISLIWYTISYVPGGQTGLHFFSKIFTTAVTRKVNKNLPA
ncbi:uncharacterized protein LOC143250762 isoform X2 [Tachypleus tridentatus]|uniref:uncharacterized protein LOC143250762 isoform X2 n=1 Tax=Tachypleus tridentatus TaxID=6853 RepID=UPI003FD43BD8